MSETAKLEPKIYEIGLVMSGAISAGAYTAGVFDFLVQAMDEWEAAKHRGEDVPQHQVSIKVMAGASAGAITSIVGALTLARAQTPVREPHPASGQQIYKRWLTTPYETWVIWPRLAAPQQVDPDIAAMLPPATDPNIDFLQVDDIISGGLIHPVISVLNCKLLDYIAGRALIPGAGASPRSYLPKSLPVYVTTTNLRGVPYAVSFAQSKFYMKNHADRIHYQIEGLGTWATRSEFASTDAGQTINPAEITGTPPQSWPPSPWPPTENSPLAVWYAYAQAALASSAFPVGLAPRPIQTLRVDYANRNFPGSALLNTKGRFEPAFPPVRPQLDANYVATDGGVINNDPFDYAEAVLRDPHNLADQNDPLTNNQAIIMIAPFPTKPSYLPEDTQKLDIFSIFSSLNAALKDQVRFKLDALLEAADPDNPFRYMISPQRTDDEAPLAKKYAMASALLGGFGGFVDRGFRDHDFQLGRRNCQRFLQKSLMLPAANPLFAADGPDRSVIPLVGSALDPVPLLPWPQQSREDFTHLQKRIAERYGAVAKGFAAQFGKSWFARIGIRFVFWLLRCVLLDKVKRIILADMAKRDLIAGLGLPKDLQDPEAARAVVVSLITSKEVHQTAQEIAEAIALDLAIVQAILNALQSADADALCCVVGGETIHPHKNTRYRLHWRHACLLSHLF